MCYDTKQITEWEMLRAPVSEMTYTVSSGTLNPSIPYLLTLKISWLTVESEHK